MTVRVFSYFVAKWLIVSVGVAVAVWAAAILACGCLALQYGDDYKFDGKMYKASASRSVDLSDPAACKRNRDVCSDN